MHVTGADEETPSQPQEQAGQAEEEGAEEQEQEQEQEGTGTGEEQEGEGQDEVGVLVSELAETLTVTVKKLKNITLGRGWTTKPKKPPSHGQSPHSSGGRPPSRSHSPSGPPAPLSQPRPASSGTHNKGQRDPKKLREEYACSVCNGFGH